MLSNLLTVISSLVLLARGKECIPGQNCELRCCTLREGDVLCRQRCLGLSCESDVHCGGDCCVNATCSSCLLKRLSLRRSSDVQNSSQPDTELEQILLTTEAKAIDRQDGFSESTKTSPTKGIKTGCLQSKNDCSSKCCINGKCVDSFRCEPVKAARGGKGGGRGGRGGGRGGRRGGGGGSGVSGGGTSALSWGIMGGILLIGVVVMIASACSSH